MSIKPLQLWDTPVTPLADASAVQAMSAADVIPLGL